MRRAALIAAVVLAGCGGGGKDEPRRPADQRGTQTKRERTELQRVREQLRKSSLPKDMQRELEEAQRLLDEAN